MISQTLSVHLHILLSDMSSLQFKELWLLLSSLMLFNFQGPVPTFVGLLSYHPFRIMSTTFFVGLTDWRAVSVTACLSYHPFSTLSTPFFSFFSPPLPLLSFSTPFQHPLYLKSWPLIRRQLPLCGKLHHFSTLLFIFTFYQNTACF